MVGRNTASVRSGLTLAAHHERGLIERMFCRAEARAARRRAAQFERLAWIQEARRDRSADDRRTLEASRRTDRWRGLW